MPASTTPETYPVDDAGHRLRSDAAASYLRMLAAGMPTGGIDVYVRTLAQQKILYRRFLNGRGPVAAKPSPAAPHVRGVAMDAHTTGRDKRYDPSAAHEWMTKGGDGSRRPEPGEELRAHDFGWFRTVRSERWHFGYDRSRDRERAADLAARLEKLGFPDVKTLQREHGLADDGKDGPLTWGVLLDTPTAPSAMARLAMASSLQVPTLARIATFNCAAFGKTSMTNREVDAIVGVLMKMSASMYTLTECPEWLRDHIRGACACATGAHRTIGTADRWRVAIRGNGFSQAILFDSMKWTYTGAVGGEFGPTSYHGYLTAGFEQTATRTVLAVGGYHLPPNVVSTASFQKSALADLLDIMPAGGARLLCGDGADESGWVTGWQDARKIALESPDRDAPTYKNSIRDRIHSRGIKVRKYTVIPSDGASDHAGVLAQITIQALP